ncbi:Hypothetical predicted protein [Pelobates cultripes]|uniref:Uncharacterized protein n=1 Tax=Pelobates cultripes TaxID=61616 RepID=A0AAD1SY64_PELCU|nr:Hypothetical predicted protein [Pelobates cultripes]
MGKKPKHRGAAKLTGAHDIGALLLRPAKAAVTPAPNQNGDSASASSAEQLLDELDDFPDTGGLHSVSSDEDNDLPSTKGDIKALLCNIRSLFAADMAVLREEIHTMEGRMRKTEAESQGLAARCVQLEAHNTELQRAQALLTTRLDAMEDRHRRRNVKIRGVPETVTQEGIQGYLGRLLASLLTPQQMKTALTDRSYRIPRAARAPADTPRDIILQFQTQTGQATFMAAVRGKASHLFETASLSFFQDLSRPTLLWRSLLKPLTTALRQASVPYRWAFPRSLLITHKGASTRVTDPSEIDSVLTALGLSPRQEQANTDQRPKTQHTWDVANVRPFQSVTTGASSSTAYKAQRANRHLADT